MVMEDVCHGGEHDDRHDQRADAMREVDRDAGVPERRDEVAKRQRKVGIASPSMRMPHRRAEQDLRVDEAGRQRGQPGQRRIVNGRRGIRHPR